jgi:hypothetical protein
VLPRQSPVPSRHCRDEPGPHDDQRCLESDSSQQRRMLRVPKRRHRNDHHCRDAADEHRRAEDMEEQRHAACRSTDRRKCQAWSSRGQRSSLVRVSSRSRRQSGLASGARERARWVCAVVCSRSRAACKRSSASLNERQHAARRAGACPSTSRSEEDGGSACCHTAPATAITTAASLTSSARSCRGRTTSAFSALLDEPDSERSQPTT